MPMFRDEPVAPSRYRTTATIELTPKRKYLTYGLFGVLTFGVSLLRNIGANSIPGSIFSLLISSSIVFNMLLSRCILRRPFNRWHVAAAAACVTAATCIGVAAAASEQNDVNAKGHQLVLGMACALAAAFFIALMSVLSDKLTKSWPDNEFHIAELTIVASLIASGLLVITLFANQENLEWGPELNSAWQTARTWLVVLSCLLPAAKALVRTSKYTVIAITSAFLFEFVQAASAVMSSIANILLFQEPWNWGLLVAIPLVCCAFALYSYGNKQVRPMIDALVNIEISKVARSRLGPVAMSSESIQSARREITDAGRNEAADRIANP
jgi:drug/metabolite transporter (DMT)-like permease